MTANSLHDELLDVLSQMIATLRQDGTASASFWVDWLEKSHKEISAHDFHGVEYLLRAYGGMGSLNDLVVSLDQRRLQTRAWEIASALRREHYA
jgi:hypothetical protein